MEQGLNLLCIAGFYLIISIAVYNASHAILVLVRAYKKFICKQESKYC